MIPRNFGLRLYVICCLLRYTAGNLLDWLWLLFGLVCLPSHELSIVCDSKELWAQVVLDLLSTEVYSWTSSWLAAAPFRPCLSVISWAVDRMWFHGTLGSGCTWSVVYWGIQLDIFLIGCGFFLALFVCYLMSCRSYVIPWNFGLRLYLICCLLRYSAGNLLDWLWLLFGLVCLPSHELSIVCDSMELLVQVVRDLLSIEVYSWTSSWLAVASFWPCLSAISWAVDRMLFHGTLGSGCTWSVVYWGMQLEIFFIGCGFFLALFVCHLMSCRSYVIPWNFGLRLYVICCLLRYTAGRLLDWLWLLFGLVCLPSHELLIVCDSKELRAQAVRDLLSTEVYSWKSSWLAVASFWPCLSAVSWAVDRMWFQGTLGSGCTWSVVYWGIQLDIFLIGCSSFSALFVCYLMSCRSYVIPWNFGLRLYVICCLLRYTAGHLLDWLWLLFGLVCLLSHELSIICDSMELWAQAVLDLLSTEVCSWKSSWLAVASFRPCLSAVSWAVNRMWFHGTFGSGCTWSVVYWGIQLDIFLIGCGFFLALFVCYLMSCRSYVIPWNFGLRLYLICCLLRYAAGNLLDWLWLLFGLVCLPSHELSIVCYSMELWAQVVRDLLSTEVYSWTSSWLAVASFWPCLSVISWAVDRMWFHGTLGSGCTWSVVYWGIQLDIFLIGCGFFSALFVCYLMSCRSYVIPWNFGLRLYLICCLLRYTAGRLLDWLWLLFGLVCLPSHELSIICDSKELWAQVVLNLLSTEVYSWKSSWLAVASFHPCLSAVSWAVDRMCFQGTLGSGCTWSVVYWGMQLDVFLIGCGFFSALFVCRLMSCQSYVIPWNFWFRLYVICCLLRYTAGHLLDWLWLLFGLVCLLSHELSIVCDSMELWAQAVLDLLSTEVCSWKSSWLAVASFRPCLSAISWAVDRMWFHGTLGSVCTWSVVYWGIQLDIFLIGCGFFSALFVCYLMSCRSYVIPWNFGLRLYVICCLLRYTTGHLLDWLWLLFGLVCLLSHELSIVCDSMELWAQAVLDLLSTEVYSWTSSWLAVASFWPCLSAVSWAVDHMWFQGTLGSGCT